MIKMRNALVFAASLAVLVLCSSDALSTALNPTIAYYECEGPAGTVLADSNQRSGPLSLGTPLIDSSGNGNTAYGWTADSWGNSLFDTNVPAATVPQTGALDTTSANSNWAGGSWWHRITTYSALSQPTGADLETEILSAWTLEASFTTHWLGGSNTIIGHSGEANGDNSKLYFQKNNQDQCIIQFVDNAGWQWYLADPHKITMADAWYQMAATSDGQTLSLYDNVNVDGTPGAMHLASTLDISASPDSAMYHQDIDAGNPGWWTFGYGQWNATDGDYLHGNLDNIRISRIALSYDSLLCVPEPGTLAMLVMAGVLGLLYKRNGK
jgi:hypothetical protein